MFVAGVDRCRAGWVCFKAELPPLATSVEVVDLAALLRKRPADLACVGIDIPIGLLDRPRACDIAARKLLGWSRRNSVFSAPCRTALRRVMAAHKDAAAEAEFRRWFAGSKVVDTQGKPMKMYHGIARVFDRFDTTAMPLHDDGYMGVDAAGVRRDRRFHEHAWQTTAAAKAEHLTLTGGNITAIKRLKRAPMIRRRSRKHYAQQVFKDLNPIFL